MEETINTAENLRAWLRECPAILNINRFNVDFMGQDPTEYAIYSTPNELSYTRDVLGNIFFRPIQELNYIFASLFSYSFDILQNLENLGFFSNVINWIYEQNITKNFPVIEEGKVISIMPTLTPYIFDADSDSARYQIQLKINYNIGDSTPEWAAIGKRVEDSSEEMDWSEETKKDIFGDTYTTLKKPTITQSFEPCELDAGDEAQQLIWNLAVKEQDAQALANMDMLIVHFYAGTAATAAFAERYTSCAIKPSSLGGEGGGSIGMPIDVTYGGARTTGTASLADGEVTFTPDGEI